MSESVQCGWLMSLADSPDSNWGAVESFYEGFAAGERHSKTHLVPSEVWGRLSRKEPVPAPGDGFAFYHSSRARMPRPDPFKRKQRISLLATLKDIERTGVQVSHITVEVNMEVLQRMRQKPIVRDENTEHLFAECGLRPGAPATFYYVPPTVWARFKALAGIAATDASGQAELDEELSAYPEGEARRAFVLHRRREAALRRRKIADAIAHSPDGHLRCEVPNCGFDFERTFGEIGRQFSEVHHLIPLSTREGSSSTTLAELRIVCSNCHRMIHRGGQNRPLEGLISR